MPAPRYIVRKVLLGLVLLSFVMAIGVSRRPQAPAVAPDCTRASFTLNTTTIAQQKAVTFTIVGPAGRRYAVGVDVAGFERAPDGTWRAVPKPGAETHLVAAAPEPMPQTCTRAGFFATPLAVGRHTVTLYEVTDAGAVFVQQHDLEVTAP